MESPVFEEIIRLLSAVPAGLSAPELRRRMKQKVSQPTLWRQLDTLRARGLLMVEGRARATRYRAVRTGSMQQSRGLYESTAGGIAEQSAPRPVPAEAPHPVQVEGFRRMTPVEKLRMVADLYRTGIQLKVAGLRMAHPDWADARLFHEARSSLLHAGT